MVGKLFSVAWDLQIEGEGNAVVRLFPWLSVG